MAKNNQNAIAAAIAAADDDAGKAIARIVANGRAKGAARAAAESKAGATEEVAKVVKARNAADDRARKAALMLTRDTLVTAGKSTARTIARAQETISKAGLALMWQFNAEGAALSNVAHEYDKDIAPIAADTIAAAYPDATSASQRTWRSYAKLFWLAGVHGVESDATTISKLTDAFRDALKAQGVIEAHANDKPKETRQPRGKVEAVNNTPAAKADATPAAPNAPATVVVFKPGKVYTDADFRQAALVLDGSTDFAPKIVKAFREHREQMHRFIESILKD